jgi:rhodanese-related sulfurtransferase
VYCAEAKRADPGCVVADLKETQTKEGRQRFMNGTYWSVYALIFGCLIAFMVMRRSGQISKKKAIDYVKDGAALIDVRPARDFNSGHLSQAFNIPLDDLKTLLPERIKDKNRVILLHCRTGLNSKKAKEILRDIGYKNVFSLGSYERAFKIVSGRAM